MVGLVLLAASSGLGACGGPAPNYAQVSALARSLSVGKLDSGTSEQKMQYEVLVASMGVKPSVRVVNETAGAATLDWDWALPTGHWRYTTSLKIATQGGGVYAPLWEQSAAIPGFVPGDVVRVSRTRGTRAPILLSDGRPATTSLGGLRLAIETTNDPTLGGPSGRKVTLQHPSGTQVTLLNLAPGNGRPVKLTINRAWQAEAESILNEAGPPAAMVVIKPSTGAIEVAADNDASGGSLLATWGHSAAGSTWKTVDSLALIRRRHFTPDSVVTCPLHYELMGFAFKNDMYYPADALGNIPLKTAVANSCNTAMISQHAYLSYGDLKGAAETLGLTDDHNVGFPAFFGSLPKPANEFIKAEDMIGQGDVQVSPMGMAADMASIEHGSTVLPWLIQGQRPNVPPSVRPLTSTEDHSLKTIFHDVVTHGTAAGLLGLPGGPVIAKTGTAEFIRNGRDINHTWMIAAQGDLAIAVYVDVGDFGADTSGPLLRQFMSYVGPQ